VPESPQATLVVDHHQLLEPLPERRIAPVDQLQETRTGGSSGRSHRSAIPEAAEAKRLTLPHRVIAAATAARLPSFLRERL